MTDTSLTLLRYYIAVVELVLIGTFWRTVKSPTVKIVPATHVIDIYQL